MMPVLVLQSANHSKSDAVTFSADGGLPLLD